MITVTTEELINYKILPYNLYTEYGEKLFSAGEVLTPGKLLQLKHLTTIFRDEEIQLDIMPDEDEVVKDYKLYRTDRNGNILVKVIDGKLAVCPTFTN